MSRQERIYTLLQNHCNPQHLEVHDESHQHHAKPGSESHFKVIMISDQFSIQSRIDRHRVVNTLLDAELKNGLHALSLHLYSPAEWQQRNSAVAKSPTCRGGSQV